MAGTETSDAWAEVLWIPLGAGDSLPTVRWSGRAYEYLNAAASGRPAVPLFHAALLVGVDDEEWVIEMAPAWGRSAASSGVVMRGPVYLDVLGRSKYFTYEVRCWRGGAIPDQAFAVGQPVRFDLSSEQARTLLALPTRVPRLRWGRRAFGTTEMWNSNSLIAWVLTNIGIDAEALLPPQPGRAPGWQAGIELAGQRRLSSRTSLR